MIILQGRHTHGEEQGNPSLLIVNRLVAIDLVLIRAQIDAIVAIFARDIIRQGIAVGCFTHDHAVREVIRQRIAIQCIARAALVDCNADLVGMEGIFDQPDGEKRAIVLLELLGKSNRIKVQSDWLAKAA